MKIELTKAQQRVVRDNPLAARLIEGSVFGESGCWLWQGTRATKGYGSIAVDGEPRRVHRAAYECFVGPIPERMFVCHHCDTPSCIRPAHLFLGDAATNMRDMVRKGRGRRQITSDQSHFKDGRAPRGERASGSKLTEAQAQEIIAKRRSGVTTKVLAAEYGVDRSTVQRLVRGQNWNLSTERTPNRWSVKLSPEDIEAIRASTEQQSVLARRYGVVATTTIANIRKGVTWKTDGRAALERRQ